MAQASLETSLKVAAPPRRDSLASVSTDSMVIPLQSWRIDDSRQEVVTVVTDWVFCAAMQRIDPLTNPSVLVVGVETFRRAAGEAADGRAVRGGSSGEGRLFRSLLFGVVVGSGVLALVVVVLKSLA